MNRVDNILRTLPAGAFVLDLGCGAGSFRVEGRPFTVVRVDLERHAGGFSHFVQAHAGRLPFPPACFDAVISNHSLEHFEDLTQSLHEIGRVLKSSGALYVAVPDSTTLSDRLYRWLARGGGHINRFASAKELASQIEAVTGLRHIATRPLCSSFSFLNRKNRRTRAPKRLLLLGAGFESTLLAGSYLLRLADRFLRRRLTAYGWALYFGCLPEAIDCRCRTNVCIRCGSGHRSDWLSELNLVRTWLFFSTYRCPACGAANLFSRDEHYVHFAAS